MPDSENYFTSYPKQEVKAYLKTQLFIAFIYSIRFYILMYCIYLTGKGNFLNIVFLNVGRVLHLLQRIVDTAENKTQEKRYNDYIHLKIPLNISFCFLATLVTFRLIYIQFVLSFHFLSSSIATQFPYHISNFFNSSAFAKGRIGLSVWIFLSVNITVI